MVEHGSGDGSVAQIRAACRRSGRAGRIPHGLAGGGNLGVAHVTGEYPALLNNDGPDRTGSPPRSGCSPGSGADPFPQEVCPTYGPNHRIRSVSRCDRVLPARLVCHNLRRTKHLSRRGVLEPVDRMLGAETATSAWISSLTTAQCTLSVGRRKVSAR